MSYVLRMPRWQRGAAHQEAGDAARDRKEWRIAAEHYRAYLRANPKAFAIWVQLGHMLKESQQYPEATQAYDAALRLDPEDADLLLNLGHLSKLMGQLDDAIEFYRKSAAVDDNRYAREELRRMGGSIESRSGDARDSSHSGVEFPSPSRIGGRPWRPLRRAGDVLRNRQRWRAAARCYRWYLKLNPRDTQIWVQLGHMLKESGRSAEAADAYARALLLDESDSDLLLNYARLCQLLGRVDDAVNLYRHSIDLDGNSHAKEALRGLGASATASLADKARDAQLAAGEAARERREWRLAGEHYRAYLRLNPSALAIWVRFGQVLQEAQQYAEAARAYDTAQRLDPDDADLLLRLGELSKITSERP